MNAPVILDRRRVLAGGGALIVSFSLTDAFAQDQSAPVASRPGSLKGAPFLDSWIRIDADGSITVFTGKAELGQGFKTACQQIAAEELDVPFASLQLVTADTSRTANEGYTSGSNSMKESGTAVQHAAAQVRALLIMEAARRLELPAESLNTGNGAVIAIASSRCSHGGSSWPRPSPRDAGLGPASIKTAPRGPCSRTAWPEPTARTLACAGSCAQVTMAPNEMTTGATTPTVRAARRRWPCPRSAAMPGPTAA